MQDDLIRLVEIYNQAIVRHNATADTTPFQVEERQEWFNEHLPEEYPIYVYEGEQGMVLGWLSLSPYRSRPALKRTAEVSYYVDYACHGMGIGSTLLEHAIAESPRLGRKILVAILLEWNTASIKLLKKFGFEQWGRMPDVAEIDGRTCAHLYFGRNVQESH